MNRSGSATWAIASVVASALTGACGGGGDNGFVECSTCGLPLPYAISVTGLAAGSSALLQDTSGNTITVSANGTLTFTPLAVLPRVAHQIGLLVQPAGQLCTATNGVADATGTTPVSISCAAAAGPAALALYAGMVHAGGADGTGMAASFQLPGGLAVGPAGDLFVADTYNSTIRKVAAGGVVTTLAGTAGVIGSGDGSGAAAGFYHPSAIAVDAAGNAYVADTSNSTIRKITPAGLVSTFAGSPAVAGSNDGTGAAARFSFPQGIALDAAGNLYVADSNNRTIRKITPAGVVTTLAGTAGVYGVDDGTGAAAQFALPQSLVVDGAGTIYVSDTATKIRKVTPAGVVTTLPIAADAFGQLGIGVGSLSASRLALAVDAAADLYAAGTTSAQVLKITPAGAVSTVIGRPGQFAFNSGPLPGSLLFPQALALQGSTMYISVDSGIASAQNVP